MPFIDKPFFNAGLGPTALDEVLTPLFKDTTTAPVTGVFGTGSLDLGHTGPFSITTFASGTKVLVLGDYNGNAISAEVWDVATNDWTQLTGPATGSTPANIDGHVGVLLANGNVLIAGGENWDANSPGTFLFNGTTFVPTGSPASRHTEAAGVLLANGKVLLVGGYISYNNVLGTVNCDLYDPSLGTWAPTGSLNTQMQKPRALRLGDGRVLAMFGSDAETYNPGTGLWTTQPNPPISVDPTTGIALMSNGNVFITNGYFAYAFVPGTNTWTTLTAPQPAPSSGINNAQCAVRIGTKVFIPEGGAFSWFYDTVLDSWAAGPVGILPSPYYVVSLSTDLALYVQNNDLDTQMYGTLTLTPQIRLDASANTTVIRGRASEGETGVIIKNRADLSTGIVLDVQNQGLSQLKVEAIAANETRTTVRELAVGLGATVAGAMTAGNFISNPPDSHFKEFSRIDDNLTIVAPAIVSTGAPSNTSSNFRYSGQSLTPTGGLVIWGGGNIDSIARWEPGDLAWNLYNGPGYGSGTDLPALTLLADNLSVLMVGGQDASPPFNPRADSWLFTLASNTVAATTGNPALARTFPATALLSTGKILLVGNGTACELYDPVAGTWSATGALPFSATTRPFLVNVTQGANAGKILCLHNEHASLYTVGSGTWATAESGLTGTEKFKSIGRTATGSFLAFRRSDDELTVKAQYWSKNFNFWYDVPKPADYQFGNIISFFDGKPLVIDSDSRQSWFYLESGVPSSSYYTQGPDIILPFLSGSIIQAPSWAREVSGPKVLVYGQESSRFVESVTYPPQQRIDFHEFNTTTFRGRPGHNDLFRFTPFGSGTPVARMDYGGRLAFSYTDNSAQSSPVRADTVTGRCAFATANSPTDRVKVKNNLVRANSIIIPVLETVNDATLTLIRGVIVENGAFTFVGNTAPTGTVFVRWYLLNGADGF